LTRPTLALFIVTLAPLLPCAGNRENFHKLFD
jgi:hypothetical protein